MYKKGDVLTGVIKEVNENGLVIKLINNVRFFIPVSLIGDISKYKSKVVFKENLKINFYVESFDEARNSGIGNFKINHPLFCWSPFKNEIKETKHGFSNLFNSFEEVIKEHKTDGDSNG